MADVPMCCLDVRLVRSFCTALKPAGSAGGEAAVGRACGLRPVPPAAAKTAKWAPDTTSGTEPRRLHVAVVLHAAPDMSVDN